MKVLHHIPHSYCDAMATDPNQWMVPMQIEMDMLKVKHTWDLVNPRQEQISWTLCECMASNGMVRERGLRIKPGLLGRDICSNSESTTTKPGQ